MYIHVHTIHTYSVINIVYIVQVDCTMYYYLYISDDIDWGCKCTIGIME